MRQIVINAFVTLDGVMQAPGGPEEDRSGNFKYGGWSANYWDDKMEKTMAEFLGKDFDLLLGRKTYEIFAAHWPYIKNDPAADKLNAAKKYVVSRTLEKVDWQNSNLVQGDVVKEIIKLKQKDGPEIQVHGSANLIQTLLKNNLIDELQLMIFPMIIGKGKRLFEEGVVPSAMKLVDQQQSATGVIVARYQPAGEINVGSFALAEPTEAEVERRQKWAVENE